MIDAGYNERGPAVFGNPVGSRRNEGDDVVVRGDGDGVLPVRAEDEVAGKAVVVFVNFQNDGFIKFGLEVGKNLNDKVGFPRIRNPQGCGNAEVVARGLA